MRVQRAVRVNRRLIAPHHDLPRRPVHPRAHACSEPLRLRTSRGLQAKSILLALILHHAVAIIREYIAWMNEALACFTRRVLELNWNPSQVDFIWSKLATCVECECEDTRGWPSVLLMDPNVNPPVLEPRAQINQTGHMNDIRIIVIYLDELDTSGTALRAAEKIERWFVKQCIGSPSRQGSGSIHIADSNSNSDLKLMNTPVNE
jgi:hypothetical protein